MRLPTLKTQRLTLRHLTVGDLDALFRLFSDRQLTRFWGHPPIDNMEGADALLTEIENGAAEGSLLQWGITENERHEVIGTCTLAYVNREHRRADLGVFICGERHGEGLAQEAARAIIGHGFGELDLHRITADVDPRNKPSLKLLARLGFEQEGRLREHYWQDGTWHDGLLFGLLRRNWQGAAA